MREAALMVSPFWRHKQIGETSKRTLFQTLAGNNAVTLGVALSRLTLTKLFKYVDVYVAGEVSCSTAMHGEDDYNYSSHSRGGARQDADDGHGAPSRSNTLPRPPRASDNKPLPVLYSVHHGTVKALIPAGAIVDLGPWRSGLVHLSQLSSTRVEAPEEVVAQGERVFVKVIAVDVAANRVSLSLKACSQDDGTDRDPMNVEGERLSRGRQRGQAGDEGADGDHRGGDNRNAITLGAIVAATCSRCGTAGHLAFECFSRKGEEGKYALVVDEDALPKAQQLPPPVPTSQATQPHSVPLGPPVGRGAGATLPAWMTAPAPLPHHASGVVAGATALQEQRESVRHERRAHHRHRDSNRSRSASSTSEHKRTRSPHRHHRSAATGDGAANGPGHEDSGRQHHHHRHRSHRSRHDRSPHRDTRRIRHSSRHGVESSSSAHRAASTSES